MVEHIVFYRDVADMIINYMNIFLCSFADYLVLRC